MEQRSTRRLRDQKFLSEVPLPPHKQSAADSAWPLLQAPIYINWNLTYACPFNCLHCYSRERNKDSVLSFEQKLIIADNITRNGVFYVSFGGGEPLCDPDLLAVIRRLNARGVYVNVITSGYLVSPKEADALAAAGVGGIIVSIDSANPSVHDRIRNHPGAFHAALACIRLFRERSVNVSLSTVVTKANLYEMEEILQLAETFHCTGVELKRMKLVGNALNATELALGKEDEKYLYAHIQEWDARHATDVRLIYSPTPVPGYDPGCLCGKSVMTILSNGDMSACAYAPIIIGNALRDEISRVWMGHELLKEYRENRVCPGLQWRQTADTKEGDE